MTAPIQKISVAGITAAIWENAGKEGKPYFSVSIEKRYKTESGEWKSSSSFKPADLPKAVLALQKAYEFVMLQNTSETQSEL
ncbi:MAG: hypothetical protein V1777_02825 [Candidatus Micrarchaeota archaeon]